MNNVIKRIEVDIYSPTSYEIIKAQQGDNRSRLIEFSLYNQGNPFTIPNNILIKLEGHRGDNSSFIRDDNCTVSNNIITVTLDSDVLYEAGTVEAKIVMYDLSNDSILSTIPFKIHVQKNPCDKNKVEKEKRSLIDWLILNFEKLKTSFNEHANNFLNPHKVNQSQVGLGNVDNTADIDKNVKSAKKLTMARKINGTSFDGTDDIITNKWGKERTIKLSGDVSASKSIDGSTDIDISVEVKDNSHNHTVSNISDLAATANELNVLNGITANTTELNYTDGVTSNIQTQLNSKAPNASPILTGIPKAPTASSGTNTTQIATTAFTQTAVSNHNASSTSHDDIRSLITGLSTRLNALADSDDTTLDQLSEIVAYIKSNRNLIENVTTNKVNVSDIINNLTSTATNKPLSAKQGKILNDIITELTTTVSNKVDKVEGKGLSTNDYTNEDKDIVESISDGIVTGVKGAVETVYRKGNVNLTPANIGAYPEGVKYRGDFNETITPGIYRMLNCDNAPTSGSYHSLIVLASTQSNTVCFHQIAIKEGETDVYVRYLGTSGWSLWIKMLKSGDEVESATKAIQDGNGNNIVNTYALKNEVAPYNSLYSSFSISGTGWYRIAEFRNSGNTQLLGGYANSCDIILKRNFNNVNNEYHHIEFLATYNKFNFAPVSSQCNVQIITKMRFTYIPSTNVSYIEIYYDSSAQNMLQVSFENGYCFGGYWRPLSSPMLVLESIEGVTVGASIDLPGKDIYLKTEDLSNCTVDFVDEDTTVPAYFTRSFEYLKKSMPLKNIFTNLAYVFKNVRFLGDKLCYENIPINLFLSTNNLPNDVTYTLYKDCGFLCLHLIIPNTYTDKAYINSVVNPAYRPRQLVCGNFRTDNASDIGIGFQGFINSGDGVLNVNLVKTTRSGKLFAYFCYPLK